MSPLVKLIVIRRLAIFSNPVLKVGSWQLAVGSWQRAIGNPIIFCLLPFAYCLRINTSIIAHSMPVRHLRPNLTRSQPPVRNDGRFFNRVQVARFDTGDTR